MVLKSRGRSVDAFCNGERSDGLKSEQFVSMERRVRGNPHARCGVGENLELR